MTQEPKLIYLMRNKARRCAIGSNREEDESDVDLSLEEFLSLEKLARNIKAFTEHLAHIAQDSRDEKRAGNLRKLAEGVVGVSVHPGIEYNNEARKADAAANQEALGRGLAEIGSACVLIGLIRSGSRILDQVLANLGVDSNELIQDAEELILRAPPPEATGLPSKGLRVRGIEHGQEEARMLGHEYIGPEHLLLSVIRDQSGVGQVLEKHGLILDRVREAVMSLSNSNGQG